MIEFKSRGPVRGFMTRALAAGVLLGIYAFSLIGMTGTVMTTGMSAALAAPRGGRGSRGGRGGGGRGGRGRGGGGGNVGVGIGVGIAAGIIGGAIAADQARRNNAVEYCMQRFRSYDPGSGTYMGNDGFRHPCP